VLLFSSPNRAHVDEHVVSASIINSEGHDLSSIPTTFNSIKSTHDPSFMTGQSSVTHPSMKNENQLQTIPQIDKLFTLTDHGTNQSTP
jgi:hypothetical protein